ncbi:ras small GTPase, Ras type [Rhodotorula toruloides]|uniref:Ras small GTPase, Ras type n=1 Tax=Rhodotorula toruloides TaxID=5286 RepID=A0A511KJC5_RHOTO|nr:ras small GTPase, Ras type [Rhodotorula toruloides]
MSHTPLSAPPPSGPPQPPPLVLKTILIGDASTGKTCLRQRFVNGGFSLAYRATIGCDFLSRKWRVERDEDGREEVSLQVWDTAGQERFRSLAPAFYRNSDCCILVYSLTSPLPPCQVAASIRTWLLEFATNCPVSEDEDERRKFCWVCVGTKVDELAERGEEGEKRAKEIQEAVEKVLQELLPRGQGGRRRSEAQGGKAVIPKVSVEVLPPRGKGENLKKRRLPQVQVGDRRTEFAPSAQSALGAPNGSAAVQVAASSPTPTDSPSATALTASTASPPAAFELDEPIPDLLVATSPPSAPLHFGRAGAPPAIYEGGPYKDPDGYLMEREDLEDDSMRPDHRDGEVGEEVVQDEPEEEEEVDQVARFMSDGIKHFPRTSAKTGEGVEEVFDYIARRVTAVRAFESLSEDEHAGTPYKRGRKADPPESVIKVNEREHLTIGQTFRSACCS